MSDPVAAHITATLSTYDVLVRNGLRDGDVLEKVGEKYSEIVSFQKKNFLSFVYIMITLLAQILPRLRKSSGTPTSGRL